MATKDMASLAWLDNSVVAGKQAMVETAVLAEKVMNALGDAMPAELRPQVVEMRTEMRFVRRFSDSTWKTVCAPTVMCRHSV